MPSQPNLPLQHDASPKDASTKAQRDAERREYTERLRQYLQDPEFRQIEGFPIGEDDDILALSDPPYYTACPNPFIPEIVERWQQERDEIRRDLGLPTGDDEDYHREPFASDVSEGKNNPIYNAHSYHTKVPHKAIMRYILHYTDPGDIVLDGFCGTGMTGVAAQLCGDRKAVADLGYIVDEDGRIYDPDDPGEPISRLGARRAVLNDLSPAATFIAYNYNTPVDADAFEREARRILREVEQECGWMYRTWHPHCDAAGRVEARINYTVWSDVFICPQCGGEIIFWEAAVDQEAGKVRREFPCPHCGVEQRKRTLHRAMETVYDRDLGHTIERARQVPVLINYSVGKKRHEKAPDADDIALIRTIEESDIPYWFPTDRMPEGDESRRNDGLGITHVHHFYTRRNLWALAATLDRARSVPTQLFGALLYACEQAIMGMSKWARYVPTHYSQVNQGLSGTLYIGSQVVETSPHYILDGKTRRLESVFRSLTDSMGLRSVVECQCSSHDVEVPCGDIEYVFIDPPFGANLMYSELNFLHEAWLRVLTDSEDEVIVNKAQGKALPEYQSLMERCFAQFFAALKPGHWMTVEFHNSRNSVWNAIQQALQRAGFVVADVRTLDKQQGTFKQTESSNAVKMDLIISAYRPSVALEQAFAHDAGTPDGAWSFIREHLARLPVLGHDHQVIEDLSERHDYVLYDRMVAFHLTRGATVPLSAAEFYAGLRERFLQRDGMYFTPGQVPEYDRARLSGAQVQQLSLFLTDEKSAIQWLRRRLAPDLGGHPQTYGDLQPDFLRELHQQRHEALPELQVLLEQNFLQDDVGRWYVPDPTRSGDLEKLRERALLQEFDDYAQGDGRLREFRSEALRVGFSHCYHAQDWETIVRVAERLPSRVLQEDADLLMYYDLAVERQP